ncbi:Uncharacterized protein FKW44_004707, partial [Caligus rogercresseyi]
MTLLDLPKDWEQRILDSLSKISDERKFTAQFQISADLLKFYRPCNPPPFHN